MPATPAAPALRHDGAFSIVTPPRASTGIFARQAFRKAARPAASVAGAALFSNTGAKTAKSAASDSARKDSAPVWHEAARRGLRAPDTELRARACVQQIRVYRTRR